MINVAGLVVLIALLAPKLTQLVRDWRGHVLGSRLKARMVWMFGVLATLPILLVYFFSVQFLNRGIDSWFHVEIRQGLDDALVLSRSALETAHARAPRGHRGHRGRAGGGGRRADAGLLETLRRQAGALEITVATEQRQDHRGEQGPLVRGRARRGARRGAAAGAAGPAVRQPRAARRGRLPDPHRRAARRRRRPARPPRRAGALPGGRAARGARRHRAGRLPAVRREGLPARAAQGQLHPDADAGAAAVAAGGVLRRDLHRAAARPADPGPDRGHARRRAGRPRHAPAADLARRDGLPRALVQRHDQAAAARARGPAARAAGGGDGAREPRDHPRAPLHRRHLARAGPAGAHRQPRRRHHPRRRPRRLRRPRPRRDRRERRAAAPVRRGVPRAHRRRRRSGASSSRSRRVPRAACSCAPARRCRRGEGEAPGGYVLVFDDITVHAAGAARGRLGRGRAPPRARDQEPADADPPLRRAHAPQAAAVDEREGRAAARPRHPHHRAAGRGDEGDGQRVQRVRARAALRDGRRRPQPAGHRGRRPLPRAGRAAAA